MCLGVSAELLPWIVAEPSLPRALGWKTLTGADKRPERSLCCTQLPAEKGLLWTEVVWSTGLYLKGLSVTSAHFLSSSLDTCFSSGAWLMMSDDPEVRSSTSDENVSWGLIDVRVLVMQVDVWMEKPSVLSIGTSVGKSQYLQVGEPSKLRYRVSRSRHLC